MRGNRFGARVLAAALLAAWLGSLGAARAEPPAPDDPASAFTDAASREAAIAAELETRAHKLATGRGGATQGTASAVVLPEGEAGSTASEADELEGRARAALGAAGWASLSAPAHLDVVTGRVAEGVSVVVVHPSRPAIFVRRPARSRRGDLPEKPDRDDGKPIARDFVDADRRLEAYLWVRSSDVADGPGSFRYAVAEVVLREAGVPDGAPDWLRRALVAWLARASSADPAAPESHVCAAPLAAGAKGLVPVLEGKRAATAMEVRLLGRVLGVLAAQPGFPAKVAAAAHTAPGSAPGDAAFAAAFGTPLDAAFAAATEGVTASGGPCDRQGGIDCPICTTPGSVSVACPNCEGLGKILCTACAGNQRCPCSFCYKGTQYLPGNYLPTPCVFCAHKGKTPCLACGGRPVRTCRLCSGSGRLVRACPSCAEGRIPCPLAGRDPYVDARRFGLLPCPWCRDAKATAACPTCRGTAFTGCADCAGLGRIPCDSCLGTGRTFRQYSIWWAASGICDKCGASGSRRCGACSEGKHDCPQCGGKGLARYDPAACGLCGGRATLVDEAGDRALLDDRAEQVTEDEAAENAAMVERAVAYLLTCAVQAPDGKAFALRYFTGSRKGDLGEPNLFSNAFVIWTLAMAGVDRKDPRVAPCWVTLRSQADAAADAKRRQDDVPSTQEVSLALRALISGGEDPQGPLVTKLIQLLVKGQRTNGFWADDVISKEPGEAFQSLFAIESLYLAQRAGAKVPGTTFARALTTAGAQVRSGGPTDLKGEWLSATDVASNVALVVLAKAGGLGKQAASFDYASLPSVKGGTAFLDRYFDVRQSPIFALGARNVAATDAGYSAYLFAVQRLAQLLSIPVLNGEHWAVSGTRYLRTVQQPDGSFIETSPRRVNGPVRCTCSALLFLVRATQPITSSQDK